MALDKAKTLRAAEKYLATGKIAAAIKEYCQIVAVDTDDFTTLNMLGDLYTRVGNTTDAISCFLRIAEHYREQGFGLKAIAMYKKIDRLQPNNVEVATTLADLYAQQDLVVEARAHYLTVVEAHNRAGAVESALEILRRIADLDPQNTQIRTKLADGYLKQGLNQQAVECFAEAGQVMVGRGAFDDALEVFTKALVINPADYVTLKGVLAAHCARGTADEAAELIQDALTSNAEDAELLTLLATAHVEADDPEQAERATHLLVTKDPAAYLRFIEIARLYLRHGKIAEAVTVVARISEQMLAEREQQQLLDLIDELLVGDADNVEALRLLVRAHWWLRDTDSHKAALERLAEAAQAQGLEQDERYALTQLAQLDPEHQVHIARLNELGGAVEETAIDTLRAVEAVAETQPAPPASTDDFILSSEEFVTTSNETTFDWNPVTEVSAEEAPSGATIETGFSFDSIVAEELPASPLDAAGAQPVHDAPAAMLRQELESVDFYIAQGYIDIAVDTLDLLEQQCGPHSEIVLRREQIKHLQFAGSAETDASAIERGQIATPDEVKIKPAHEMPQPETQATADASSERDGATQTVSGIDAGLAEIFEEYRVSSENEGETASNGDYETHYNLGLAYKEMDLFDDALEEFQIAVNLTSPGEKTSRYLQCCNLLGHCFVQTGAPEVAVKWFTKGLGSAHISDEERMALTYEIAAAYEQAGDVQRALESFIEVYEHNVSYRNVNERVKTLKARLAGNTIASPIGGRSEQLLN